MIEVTHLVGIVVALFGAAANGASQLWIRVGTEDGRTYDAVFIVMLTNAVVLLPLVAIIYYPDYGLTRGSWLSFIAAGVLGTMLGRLFMYTSITRIGASRTAPIVAAQALFATVFAVLVLGERLSIPRILAIVLIVAGVAGIAWETTQENPEDLPLRALLIGLLFPLGAALAYGWEPIFATIGFEEGTPAPVGLVIKTVSATIGFLAYLRWKDALPGRSTFANGGTRWFLLAGLGNTVFLLCYYLALEIAPVSIVVPINITYLLFVLLFSGLFMPRQLERVTRPLVVAAVVVVVGIVVLTLSA